MIRIQITTFLALLFFFSYDVYCQECIGLTRREKIPDHYFTASSSYDRTSQPYFARLDSKTAWRPLRTNNNGDHIQVDLAFDYQLCTIATKGGNDYQWTTRYSLSYSLDNHRWIRYHENGKLKIFSGNRDGDSLRKNALLAKPTARFVRVYPSEYNKWKALKLELYGTFVDNCKNPLGFENYGIDNSQISTSQPYSSSSHNSCRLHSQSSWQPSPKEKYLQVDLGEMKFITGIATQGDPQRSMWVTSYTLEFKSFKGEWYEYTPSEDMETFDGNVDNTGVRANWFDVTNYVRYIRITPKTWHNGIALRMELYGCAKTCDNQPIETLKSDIIGVTLPRDGNTTPPRNKNSTSESYCFDNRYSGLKVDLGIPYLICAIATRSTEENWVEAYTMQTSLDDQIWKHYKEDGNHGSVTSFAGNMDHSLRKKNVLKTVIFARYIRLLVAKKDKRRCMKIEAYGITVDSCSRSIAGASAGGQLPYYHFTASSQRSSNQNPTEGRLHGPSCWSPQSNDQFDYLQIDLGDPWTVCAIASQGCKDETARSYNFAFSMDGVDWTFYQHDNQRVIFHHHGNVKRQLLPTHVTARFVRFYPLTYMNNKAMKVEIYGALQAWRQSLGIEQRYGVSNISDRQLTVSESLDSVHVEREGRLYGMSSWCTKQEHKPYFQVGRTRNT